MSSTQYMQQVNSHHKYFKSLKKVKKNILLRWAKKDLITPLSSYMELKFKWVPKSNKWSWFKVSIRGIQLGIGY